MKRRLILLILGAAIILGVRYFWTGRADHQVEPSQNELMERVTGQTAIEKLFGGKDAVATVTHPDKVEVFRLDPAVERADNGKLKHDDFRVAAGPIDVPVDIASRLANALVLPESYRWGSGLGCAPRYGVRVRFQQGADCIDVLLCFECDLSLVFRNRREVGCEYFKYAHNSLVRAVQELFPDDNEIQSLKSR